MPDDTDDTGTDNLEELFESWYEKRTADEQAKKDRRKEPKDFGEFIDRVADAVWDRGEERAAARRQTKEEADQPPSRGEGKSSFASWWNRESEAS